MAETFEPKAKMRVSKSPNGVELVLSNISISGTDVNGNIFSTETPEKILISSTIDSMAPLITSESNLDDFKFELSDAENGIVASNKVSTIYITKSKLISDDIPKQLREGTNVNLDKASTGILVINDSFKVPFDITIPSRGFKFRVEKGAILTISAQTDGELMINVTSSGKELDVGSTVGGDLSLPIILAAVYL